MWLCSKNLLMGNSAEPYEILESIRLNPKCFFILDETEFTTWDYSVEITLSDDTETVGYNTRFFRYGLTADGTACTIIYDIASSQKRATFYTGNQSRRLDAVGISTKTTFGITRVSNEQAKCLQRQEDGTAIINYTIPSSFNSSKGSFGIFGTDETNSTFKGVFYNFTLTIEGNTVYDLVPARRNSDGELGLLNKVDGKFYENQGSGTIERGEEIA